MLLPTITGTYTHENDTTYLLGYVGTPNFTDDSARISFILRAADDIFPGTPELFLHAHGACLRINN